MKRVTVKDLAKELNVSLNTINKGLNNKPGISEETREKIIETAARMGYQVNRVAQSLARNPVRFGIIMPEEWPEYYDCLKQGIDLELNNLRDYNISGKYYMVPGLHSKNETSQAIQKCIKDQMSAMIICPNQDIDDLCYVHLLNKSKIPVITLGADLPGADKLCCIRVNACASGKLAAEFMKWLIAPEKTVAIFIGNKDFSDHKEKVDGFLEVAKANAPRIEGIFETQDDPELAYHLSGKLIKERPELGGIYVATGNSIAVCKYIEKNNIHGLRILGTDIFDEIKEYVKRDFIQGVIFQDPVKQGRYAVKAIYDALIENVEVDKNIFVTPQLVLKSNIEYY